MKQLYFLLSVLLFAATAAFGQDAELKQLLTMKDDTIKVQELSAYAKKVVHNDHGLSRKASAEILRISEKLNYPKGIATGYSYLAFIELQEQNHASAPLFFCRRSATLYR
jgi:hypothetical protein